eukprot:g410.t1
MTTSLNDLEAQLAALERASSDDEVVDDQDAASNVSSEVDSESDVVFSSDDEGPAGPAGGSSPGAGGKRKSKGENHQKSKGDEQQRSSGARLATSSNDTSGTHGACAAGASRPQTERAKAAKQRVRDHVRKGFSKVCFRFLRDNACNFENCLFEHKKLSELSDAELIALRKELEFKPFCEKLALKIQNLNIPVCKEYKQYGSCSMGEAKCRYWHLKNAAVAKWAGFGYWCEACWKPITSLEAWEEHVKSKRHRDMVPRHLRHLSTTSFYAKLSKVPLCEDLDNQVLRKGEACYSSCGKTKSRQKCDPRVAEYGLSFSKNEDCRSRIECVAEDRVLCMLDKGGVDEAGMGGGGGVLGKAVLTAAAGGGAGAGRDLDPGRKRSTSKKKLAATKVEHEQLIGQREQIGYQIESAQQRAKEMQEEKAFLEQELKRVEKEGTHKAKQTEAEIAKAKQDLKDQSHKLHYASVQNEIHLGAYVGSVFDKDAM